MCLYTRPVQSLYLGKKVLSLYRATGAGAAFGAKLRLPWSFFIIPDKV